MPYLLSSAVVPPQGWCPSTHRIHAAPDGGLARVKVPGGRLTLVQLAAIADAARRHGTGVIDLTSRANVQIRGLADDAAAAGVRSRLAPEGLSHPSVEVEDRRNVLASPTAGLGDELLDVTALVAATVAALDDFPRGPAPAHKFGVLLDGGGSPSLRGLSCDVAVGAVTARHGGVELEVALGQALADVTTANRIVVDGADVPALVVAAAQLAAATTDAIRMTDVVAALGHDEVVRRLQTTAPLRHPDGAGRRAPAPTTGAPLGWHDGWLGVRPISESASADQLDALVEALAPTGTSEVRLTPWRSLVVPVGDRRDHMQAGTLAAAGWTDQKAGAPGGADLLAAAR